MNSRTQALSRMTLAITLALFSTGCTVPPGTAGGPGSLPTLPTGLLGQTNGAGLFTNPDPLTGAAQQVDEPPVQVAAAADVDDGAATTDTFDPPTRPGHDENTALRNRAALIRSQLSAAQQRLSQLQATRPSICGNGPVAPCEASNQRRLDNIAAAQAEVDGLNAQLNDIAGQLGVGA